MSGPQHSPLGILGILFTLGVIFIIVLGNMLVYISFRSNPNLFFNLINNAANFPKGLLTAIFAPDASVLNGSQTFTDWYVGFAVALVIYFGMFLATNISLPDWQLGTRSIFFGLMLVVISVLSNAFTLVRDQSSAGPSTATFAAIGLVLGFSLLNVGSWFARKRPMPHEARQFVSIVGSSAITVAFVLLSILSPAVFFNINPALRVDWIAHLFCYVLGAIVPVTFMLLPKKFGLIRG